VGAGRWRMHHTVPLILADSTVGSTVYFAQLSAKNVSCAGLCDGTITAEGINGQAPYSYEWNTGSNDTAIFGLCPGKYTCTVIDSRDSIAIDSITITQPLPLSITYTVVNPPCDGLCNGGVNTYITGGTGPYSYLWNSDTAQTGSYALGLCAGQSNLVVTDNNQCTLDTSFVLSVAAPPVTVVSRSVSCGDSLDFEGRYYHVAGTYNDTVTNIMGCDSILSLQLTVIGGDTSYLNDTICSNDSIFFNGQYYTAAGSYTAHYTSSGNCDSAVILQLSVNPDPVVTFTWDSLGYANDVDTFDISFHPLVANWCQLFPDAFVLSGGNPAGGIYSGVNVSNDSLYVRYPENSNVDTIRYTVTDANQCTASVSAYLDIEVCSGIQTIAPGNLFDLYPNPAGDYTMIAVNPNAIGSSVQLFDITGNELLHVKLSETPQRLPISALPAGVYMVSVESKGERAVKLLVKTE
jgi:hypothetical protein